MNVSRDLFRRSNIEAYIVVSCETVVRSGTNLTCGTVGNLVSGVAAVSGGTGFVTRSRILLGPGIVACSISIIRLA